MQLQLIDTARRTREYDEGWGTLPTVERQRAALLRLVNQSADAATNQGKAPAKPARRKAVDLVVRLHWDIVAYAVRIAAAGNHYRPDDWRPIAEHAAAVALLRSARRWEPGRCSFRVYARANCVRDIRRAWRDARLVQATHERNIEAAKDRPTNDEKHSRDCEAVHEALLSLPPIERRIVDMVSVQGVTVAEAAQRLGVPLDDASDLLEAAHDAIRRRIE